MGNTVEKLAAEIIGDGKTPNKYFISISNDYYYFNDGSFDWISDKGLFEVKTKTIKSFDTYEKALNFVNENLAFDVEYDDIHINHIAIEDRISGQVYEQTKHYIPDVGKFEDFSAYEDIQFTKEELSKRGIKFK